MTELLEDERIQFYLRNREDIKTWAAIEPDVMAATRELLARCQPAIEERILSLDDGAVVGRHDNGPFERILVRHDDWPATVGLALQWPRSVDPHGATRPKLGVFWWADPPSLIEPRTQFVNTVDKELLLSLGCKVPLESVWPVGCRAEATVDWWREPAAWIATMVDLLAATWPVVSPEIDRLLAGEAPVSDG
jgi:hypothetical protein